MLDLGAKRIPRMINRILSAEKKRNRGHLIQDTGDLSQACGSEGPGDKFIIDMFALGQQLW